MLRGVSDMEILVALLFYLMIGLVTFGVSWWKSWRHEFRWNQFGKLMKSLCALLLVVLWPYQWYLFLLYAVGVKR